MSLAESLVASSSRPLGMQMRADLTARRHKYQGRSYWVVKEPVGLRYFRFQEEEFAVLNMLKKGVSLEDIKERFEAEFAPHKITYQDLQQFIGTLHRSGLVISDAPGQGVQLKKRADERWQKETLAKFSNILAVRTKGIDPEWLLKFLYPFTRWLFAPVTALIFGAFGLLALSLLAVNFDEFQSRLPDFQAFFGPENWFYLAIVLGTTKVIHEFGHGLLCHHFGGECHEMGVMLLVLTPCLYCNVSDSWMLPSKWQRAAIGAGGIYFELIMATIATFVWWFTEPGTLNVVALRVMFICSISTVLFNGNPLLRFDGYYILSDLIEIPNLRQKASKIMQQLAGEYCLGLEMPEDPFLPQSNQAMFGLYTIAAVAYRWFIFFSILFFLNQVFEPYGLKVVGQLIAIMGLYGLIIQPMWQLGKFFHVPGRMDQVKWPRFYASVAIVAAVIAVILLLPTPRTVKCSFNIEPRDMETVFVEMDGGILSDMHVEIGQEVSENQPLATLDNYQLELELVRAEAEIKQYQAQLQSTNLARAADPTAAISIEDLKAAIQSSRESAQLIQRKLDKLVIRASRSGKLYAPPMKPHKPQQRGELPEWSGTPFNGRNRGMMLRKGDVLCQIGDPKQYEAVVFIDQVDRPFVHKGDTVRLKLDARTGDVLEGEIVDISVQDMQVAPPSIGVQAGGTLPTKMDKSGVERPASKTYEAIVPLPISESGYVNNLRGQARVEAGDWTLGERLWRYVIRTFHFDM